MFSFRFTISFRQFILSDVSFHSILLRFIISFCPSFLFLMSSPCGCIFLSIYQSSCNVVFLQTLLPIYPILGSVFFQFIYFHIVLLPVFSFWQWISSDSCASYRNLSDLFPSFMLFVRFIAPREYFSSNIPPSDYISFSFLTICSILIVYFLTFILRQNFLLGYMYIRGSVTHISSVSFSHNPIEHNYRSPYIKIGLLIMACFSQAPVFGCLNEMFALCVSDFPGLLRKPLNRSRFLWEFFCGIPDVLHLNNGQTTAIGFLTHRHCGVENLLANGVMYA